MLVLFGFMAACSHEWRTDAPVAASTYSAHSFRSSTSVGRLSRLAVLQVDLHLECDEDAQPRSACDERRVRLSRESQSLVTEYLTTQKGYEVRAVSAPIPAMDAAAMREAGQRLGVDGVVVINRWIAKPWSTAKAILNVFALDIPLFHALNAKNLRIAIYETASGQLVWQQELKGEETGDNLDLTRALGDLDNAVPPQLRR